MAQDIEVITADLMQQSEAAAELHVHLSTLRRWEAVDQGPPRIKIGRKVFYRRSSLRNWLLAHESVQPPWRANTWAAGKRLNWHGARRKLARNYPGARRVQLKDAINGYGFSEYRGFLKPPD